MVGAGERLPLGHGQLHLARRQWTAGGRQAIKAALQVGIAVVAEFAVARKVATDGTNDSHHGFPSAASPRHAGNALAQYYYAAPSAATRGTTPNGPETVPT